MKKKTQTGCGCFTLVFIILVMVLIMGRCGSDGTKNKDSTNKELDWSVLHDDSDHQAMYITIVQEAVDKYVAVAKWPWGADAYNFRDYDNNKNGCIMSMTDPLEIKNMPEKQTVIVIFSTDGNGYTIHSVAVGDKVYTDDGKLQNLLDKINGK